MNLLKNSPLDLALNLAVNLPMNWGKYLPMNWGKYLPSAGVCFDDYALTAYSTAGCARAPLYSMPT